MLIYELLCTDYGSNYVLFRTKDSTKAENFCNVYNRYHTKIFDNDAKIRVIDTSRIDRDADKALAGFRFMTEVKVVDGEIKSCKPVFVNDARINAAKLVEPLSEGVTFYYEITDDVSDAQILERYEKIVKERGAVDKKNNSDNADNAGIFN